MKLGEISGTQELAGKHPLGGPRVGIGLQPKHLVVDELGPKPSRLELETTIQRGCAIRNLNPQCSKPFNLSTFESLSLRGVALGAFDFLPRRATPKLQPKALHLDFQGPTVGPCASATLTRVHLQAQTA